MSKRSVLKQVKQISGIIERLDSRDDDQILPPANGIDRILFQARFINRAYKTDPVLMAPVIEATRKSLMQNLRSRPELAEHKAVVNALAK